MDAAGQGRTGVGAAERGRPGESGRRGNGDRRPARQLGDATGQGMEDDVELAKDEESEEIEERENM
jgi:hypothetical protein